MLNRSYITLTLLAMAGFVPSFSMQYFVTIPYESYLFKATGMIFLLIVILMLARSNFKIKLETIPLILSFSAIHFIALISEILNSIEYGIIVILRLISVLLFSSILLNLDKKSLIALLQICQKIVIILIFISLILFFSGGQYGEKFPLLNIYANQSLIFEVNMYGILCYNLFFSNIILSKLVHRRTRLWVFCISIFGVFVSFYRTVWITFVLAFFIRNKVLATLFLGGIMLIVMSDFKKYSNAFKFEQISTLTGRDVLWSAALNTFKNNPIFGGGEQKISQHIHNYQKIPWDLHSYHSVLFDVIGISGVFGILALILYTLAIVIKLRSLKNFGLFFLLYAPALLNTYYLFAPNAVAFYSTVAFLVLAQRGIPNQELDT